MTVLLGGITVLWIAVVSQLLGTIVTITAADTHAQATADAVALAAIAESLPTGSGDPGKVAADYARLNGARLVECLCVPGATAMQVSVAVGRAHASARAVFEPELLRPLVVRPGTDRSNT